MTDFTEEQKRYLEGLGRGLATARSAAAPAPVVPSGPERIHFEAQNRVLAAGGKLTREEEAKRAKHPFDMWDEIAANAAGAQFPKGTDVFLYKFHGLFYAAPGAVIFIAATFMSSVSGAERMPAPPPAAKRPTSASEPTRFPVQVMPQLAATSPTVPIPR